MPQPAVPADPSDVWTWQPFTSAAGRFTVSLPGTPEASTQDLETMSGLLTAHSYRLTTPVALFVVMYGELPVNTAELRSAEIEAMLDAGRDRLLAEGEGRLLREASTRIAGRPARDLLVAEGDFGLLHVRATVIGRRFYTVMIATEDYQRASAEDKRFYARVVSRFLDSFAPEADMGGQVARVRPMS